MRDPNRTADTLRAFAWAAFVWGVFCIVLAGGAVVVRDDVPRGTYYAVRSLALVAIAHVLFGRSDVARKP